MYAPEHNKHQNIREYTKLPELRVVEDGKHLNRPGRKSLVLRLLVEEELHKGRLLRSLEREEDDRFGH